MELLFKNVRVADDRPLVDVAVRQGKILDMAPGITGQAARVVDAAGKVMIPGLVESHLHLEKALIADRKANRSGTLQEAIAITGALKPTFSAEDIHARAARTLRMLARYGSTCVRAHAELDPAQGFTGVDAVLQLQKEFKDIIDIQAVAFPQEGIIKCPGTEAMMREAMKRGCTVMGGIPYNDLDAEEHIDLVFRMALDFDCDIDLHQDFSDDADGMCIEYVARKAMEHHYEGRICAGHATSLGALPPDRLASVAAMLADAGITIMCLPATDLHLGGRKDLYNVRRALAPVRKLRDAGVNVCLGTNNIRNAFTPFGNGDLLQIGALAIPACHLGGADDLPTVLPMLTVNAAKALKLPNYGLAKGKDADIVLLDTLRCADVLLDLPERLFVVKRGKIVVETKREHIFAWERAENVAEQI